MKEVKMSIKGDPDKFDFSGAPITPEDAAKLINTLQREVEWYRSSLRKIHENYTDEALVFFESAYVLENSPRY